MAYPVLLIPQSIASNKPSVAERKVFSAFASLSLPFPSYCLHSLNIPDHVGSKAECEIDFVFICGAGIFCLEVKGGVVRRKEGVWEFVDRYGVSTRKIEGPFQQVQGACYTLRNRIRKYFGRSSAYRKGVFGYGVIFPDINFDEVSQEWDVRTVCGKELFESNLSEYLAGLIDYWAQKKENPERLSDIEIQALVKYLRGDFEYVLPLSDYVKQTRDELVQFTDEQKEVLAALEEANPRLLVSGAAGTGKTILAVERVKMLARQRKKALFLCYSHILAGYLANALKDELAVSQVTVANFSGLVHMVAESSGNAVAYPNLIISEKSFSESDVEQAIRRLSVVSNEAPFEAMVLDEGQDIFQEHYFQFLTHIIKGGFEAGEWEIFYDRYRQAGVYESGGVPMEKRLKEYLPTCFELKKNCRNTKRIAQETEKLTDFKFTQVKHAGGVDVKPIFVKTEQERISALGSILTQLKKDGVAASQITILTTEESKVSDEQLQLLREVYPMKELISGGDLFSRSDVVMMCDGRNFKGLENDIIVIPGMKGFQNQSLLYVMMTRAKALLFLILHETLRGSYQVKERDFFRRKIKSL